METKLNYGHGVLAIQEGGFETWKQNSIMDMGF
jgi:hypothetical protein